MATNSRSSSSRNSIARYGEPSPNASPIPYRHLPYSYTPAVNCFCDERAPRWVSWSDANPGRRYHCCYKYQVSSIYIEFNLQWVHLYRVCLTKCNFLVDARMVVVISGSGWIQSQLSIRSKYLLICEMQSRPFVRRTNLLKWRTVN